MARLRLVLPFLACTIAVLAAPDLATCPGYKASNIKVLNRGSRLTADLDLAGPACNVYGPEIKTLKLEVDYETDTRIHLKITDRTKKRYEVPDWVLPRPTGSSQADNAKIRFEYTASPFSFTILRTATKEVLFTTRGLPLIYSPQYLRVATSLPANANIYGLGEHTNSFRLNEKNTTLTLWSRDAYSVPVGTNLYGAHPVYFEHRSTGSHGVLLLNSNGMDIKLRERSLEYNVIGGVVDFYFLAGSVDDPTELARQYMQVIGKPAEVPYWGFGFHQCRFGYKDYVDLARVISAYEAAKIPLETMWADIDYMDRRRTFTLDPAYFPLSRMREIVDHLHKNGQHFITMTDPAVGVTNSSENYGPYDRGTAQDIWMKLPDGSPSLGLVWPGVTVYPDWFNPKTQDYWNDEFERFYNPENGVDIDGSWIDMNEPANFCDLPCTDIYEQARKQALPPPRNYPPPGPDVPIFVNSTLARRQMHGPDEDMLNPAYKINNAAPSGALSSKTAWTNSTHPGDLMEYDTHNLFGSMMSTATHLALLARRPGLRTFVITRSTFPGAGKEVGKWLGDNVSAWHDYRRSIAGILGFAGIFGVPMVGADICGFVGNTTEELCARWAMLGAFYPFMRNHNEDRANYQEFFVWPTVAAAAQKAINVRYRLLDYIYTAFHQAHVDGTPVLQPLWYQFPKESGTYAIDTQFFYGENILVSPVTEEGQTQVGVYLPKGIWWEFDTWKKVTGKGSVVQLTNISTTDIPVHVKGGSILPLRVESAMTTTELREKPFELIIAPNERGEASGELYVDDGETIDPPESATTLVKFTYANKKLVVDGRFGFGAVPLRRIRVLGVKSTLVRVDGQAGRLTQENDVLNVEIDSNLDKELVIDF